MNLIPSFVGISIRLHIEMEQGALLWPNLDADQSLRGVYCVYAVVIDAKLLKFAKCLAKKI